MKKFLEERRKIKSLVNTAFTVKDLRYIFILEVVSDLKWLSAPWEVEEEDGEI